MSGDSDQVEFTLLWHRWRTPTPQQNCVSEEIILPQELLGGVGPCESPLSKVNCYAGSESARVPTPVRAQLHPPAEAGILFSMRTRKAKGFDMTVIRANLDRKQRSLLKCFETYAGFARSCHALVRCRHAAGARQSPRPSCW